MTQQVANATGEQKKGGEMVVKAVENISDLTRENLSSVEQLARSAEGSPARQWSWRGWWRSSRWHDRVISSGFIANLRFEPLNQVAIQR